METSDRPIGTIYGELADDGVSWVMMIMTDYGPEVYEHGAWVTKKDYPRLYEIVQDKFGSTETEFRLPDFRGRVKTDE